MSVRNVPPEAPATTDGSPAAPSAKEYSMEVVERAEDAYCVEGLTFEQVATVTGVSRSTLLRWSERYGWPDKRENIRSSRSAIRTNRILLHARLMENCLKTLKPMDAFAVSAIEGVVHRAARDAILSSGSGATPDAAGPFREIKTEADAIAALDEAVQIKVNRMLAHPESLSYGGMKEIGQALDLLKDMKAKHAEREEKNEGPKMLTAQQIKELREKAL